MKEACRDMRQTWLDSIWQDGSSELGDCHQRAGDDHCRCVVASDTSGRLHGPGVVAAGGVTSEAPPQTAELLGALRLGRTGEHQRATQLESGQIQHAAVRLRIQRSRQMIQV
jgi:hypothetical protein